ncbi:flagellar basal body rod C-terminal domain-containing protein [uncultured Phenylobacterium sp.]|uniref:flagellar basal body rod C-terminal domain-containing protein n=1 Tax=uncultured Phenylobacterium sp. TaxID=349273 RepID=UPI0025EDDCA0|nr:flagellar basal body rod C-terminal domain-containing protein [uncultured Phenylobacterium sp.]
MDPIATARYGLTAASHHFEASATRIANLRSDAGPETPGVDLGAEVVNMVQAKHAFSANLTVIRFAQDMWDSLLKLQTGK